jgi:hypothetical protein
MNAALYAFLVSSGPAGVSRCAVAAWAVRHGHTPAAALKDVQRAAARGTLSTRAGHGHRRVAATIVYYVPTWHTGEVME